jgi:hypothetical protein
MIFYEQIILKMATDVLSRLTSQMNLKDVEESCPQKFSSKNLDYFRREKNALVAKQPTYLRLTDFKDQVKTLKGSIYYLRVVLDPEELSKQPADEMYLWSWSESLRDLVSVAGMLKIELECGNRFVYTNFDNINKNYLEGTKLLLLYV